MDSNLIKAQRRRKRQERSKASDSQLHPLHHVGMELAYTAGSGEWGWAGSPCSHTRQPSCSPCIDPWQAALAQLSIIQVDREDSGTTYFHCFLFQERGWHQGAGDPVFLHLPPTCRDLGWGSIFLGLCTHYCPQLLWDQVGELQWSQGCRACSCLPLPTGLREVSPQPVLDHSQVHARPDLPAILGPQHSSPEGSLLPAPSSRESRKGQASEQKKKHRRTVRPVVKGRGKVHCSPPGPLRSPSQPPLPPAVHPKGRLCSKGCCPVSAQRLLEFELSALGRSAW